MKLAFCLFKYFPYGGLQRDFFRIAKKCQERGHIIHVYTMDWEGEKEPAFNLHLLQKKGWQNHTRGQAFVKQIEQELKKEKFDLVIGFNKMPHLDLYYAADVCYAARLKKEKWLWQQYLPRYRSYANAEAAIFRQGQTTEIMLISALQQQEYLAHYHTERARLHLLPPGIAKDRIAGPNAQDVRQQLREHFQLSPQHILLLMVGSGFKTKGLDRAVKALAALPATVLERCRLFVIGQDNPAVFIKLAQKCGVDKYLHFLGGRDDVPAFLLAADFLLHPSYHENTGTVLLEALAAGLPVLTTAVCGYAAYVKQAGAGMVLSSPFEQAVFNAALHHMIASPHRSLWQQNGLDFAKNTDIYSLPDKAADLIEQVGDRRGLISSR